MEVIGIAFGRILDRQRLQGKGGGGAQQDTGRSLTVLNFCMKYIFCNTQNASGSKSHAVSNF